MIPKNAIETAADAMQQHALTDDRDGQHPWTVYAQAALEAAAPFLRAQALEDAADQIESGDFEVPGEPYANTGLSDIALWGEVHDYLRARAATERGQG